MFLTLTQIHFPVTAIVSILHRICGVYLFLMIPWILYLLQQSLYSAESWSAVRYSMHHGFRFLLMWDVLCAAAFHVLAGLRHIAMDFGIGDDLKVAIKMSWAILVVWVIVSIFIGVWLW